MERKLLALKEKDKYGKYKQFLTWFTLKKIAFITAAAFGLSLLPLLYMCRFVHASGDDYGYGARTHAAWLSTHSLIEVFKAAGETIRQYYYGWQGTWSSIFFFTLQPEVFSPDAYWIVPPLMLGLNIIGTSLVIFYFLVKKLGFSKSVFVIVDCSVLFAMLQFIPRTKSAIFWYNGTAHYIVPYFFAMIAIYCFIRFIDDFGVRYWIGAFICMTILGGASYLSALLAPIVLIYLLVIYARKKPKVLLLLIPLSAETIGLLISILAPGNKVRGGEEMAFSIVKVFKTIGESFWQGSVTVGNYLLERPVVFIILIVASLFVMEELLQREISFEFKYPVLFAGLMFCMYCAMFAPGIYAGTEVSGGVPNTIFQVFLLSFTADIIYILGWLSKKLKIRNMHSDMERFLRFRQWITIPVLILCAILIVIFRSSVRSSTMIQCVEYVASGQAEDYKKQMDERLALLLDDSQKVVTLPEINQDQGPLMHMEVMPDTEAWTNQVACQFYGKDKIYRIIR